MPKQWFSNRGQILQLGTAVLAIVVAIVLKTGPPNIPTWLVPVLLGAAAGVVIALGLQRLSKARRPMSNPLELVGAEFVTDDRAHVTYKRKLYVTLRNDSGSAVIVGPQTAWIYKDLHVNTIAEHLWQAEGRRGWRNGDWTKEAVAVLVNPGSRVRTWVGLPDDAKKSDVDHFTAEHRAGALAASVTPVNVVRIDV